MDELLFFFSAFLLLMLLHPIRGTWSADTALLLISNGSRIDMMDFRGND